jgi:sugar lactone lactonase YvrE
MTESIVDEKFEVIVGNTTVEKIAGDFEFTEGPLWSPEGYLLFSDIPANTIYKWTPGSASAEVFRRPSGHSNGLTFDGEGRLIACEHDRRISRREGDGRVITLADRYKGRRLNSPNDIVVKSDGSIYFTDPSFGLPNREEGKELDFCGVFRLTSNGSLTLLDDTFSMPNGLMFSSDESILYVNDSARGHIRAFDIQTDGTLTNDRVFAEIRKPDEALGGGDGMKVDFQGNVFCTGRGGVYVFDPNGELLGLIKPPEIPSNVAWGDDDLKTLYITARKGLYKIRVGTGGELLFKK